MLELFNKAIRSRTVWTIVFMVVTSLVHALTGILSTEAVTLIETILGALAVYFRINTQVEF